MADLAKLGFSVDTNGLKKGIKGLKDFSRQGEKTEKSTIRTSKKLSKEFDSVSKSIGVVATGMIALGSARLIKGAIDYADTWKNVNSQIRQVTKSSKNLLEIREALFKVSIDSRSELSNTVNLFAEMSRGTKDLNLSQERLVDVTKTLNNLFVSGGKPISETIGAIRQLNQGFASGVLRGEEFNAVGEGAPKILDALSLSLDKSRAELRKFAATGGITAETMIKALESYKSEAQKLADQTEKTFGQNMQNSSTNITRFIGESESLNQTINAVGSGLELFSENLDSAAAAAESALLVVGVGLTPVMFAYTSELIATTAAQLTAGTSAVVTADAFGYVSTKAATATITTNALGMASKFLLGPWGILIAAVGAGAIAFSNSANEARDLSSEIDDLGKKAEKTVTIFDQYIINLASVEKTSLAGLGQQSLRQELSKAMLIVDEYTKKLAIMTDRQVGAGRKGKLEEKLAVQKNIIKAINILLPEASSNYDRMSKELQKLVDKLDPAAAKLRKYTEDQKFLNQAKKDLGLTLEQEIRLQGLLTEAYTKSIEKTDESKLSYDAQLAAIKMQTKELTLSANAFEIYAATQEAIANKATPEMIVAIESAIKVNQKLRKSIDDNDNLKSLTNDVDNFGGAWSKSGSIIIDTFGDISDSLGDYMKRMGEIAELDKQVAIKKVEFGENSAEVISLENKLNDEKIKAELSGMSSLAAAGQSLFDEKSSAAKAFAAIQKAITVAEIAMSFQRMFQSNVETVATVANDGMKATSAATVAVATQGQGDPYTAFARIAAMVGIMSALVSGFSGGGGGGDPTQSRQDNQGTGTVLGGDDKSQSLLNSQERFEDLQIDQLAELRGIQSSLMAIEDGISLAVRDLATGGGLGEFGGDLSGSGSDLLGTLFGKTSKKVVDSGIQFVAQSLGDILSGGIIEASQYFDILKTKKRLFGLIKSSSTTTEFEALDSSFGQAIGSIFQNIGSAVLDAASILGFETVDRLIETVTTGIFVGGEAGTVFDGAFLPLTNELGSMLGSSFETVTMTLEEALAQFTVDIGQVSLEGLTNEEIEAELQAIFSQQADLIAEYLVPSIAEYQQVGEGLFDTLLRVAKEQVIFIDQIEKMGFSLSGLSNLIQIDVAQSIIQLTGGLENFNDLSQSFFENFFTDAEQFQVLETTLEETFASLGIAMVDSRDEFKELIQGIDITTEDGQELFAALLAISPAMDDYINGLDEARDLLIDSANDAFSMLERSVAIERERARIIIETAELAHNAELERLTGLRDELEAEHDLRQDNLALAENALDKAFNAEIARINDTSKVRIKSLDDEKTAIVSTVNAMKNLVGTINKSLGLGGSLDLIGALSGAKSGDFTKAQNLDINKLANLDPKNFASASEFAIQQAVNKGRLATIGALAESKLSESEILINSISAQTESIRSTSDAEIAALENQRNELLGIQTGVLTIAEAIAQFQESQSSLDSLNYETEIAKLDMLVESANEVFALHEQAYADELARLDNILIDNENLLNAALGIDTSVKSVAEAIQFLNQTIIALNRPPKIPIKDPVIVYPPKNPDWDDNRTPDIIENEIFENKALLIDLVRLTRTSANALQQFSLNGMDTRIIE